MPKHRGHDAGQPGFGPELPPLRIAHIAGEEFIGPLAGQHHLRDFADLVAKQHQKNAARMCRRSLHMRDGPRQRVGVVLGRQRDFVMVDRIALGHHAAIGPFVVFEWRQIDAEGGEPPGCRRRRQRGHQARIDAARKLHRVADVALQMRRDRGFDGRARLRFGVFRAHIRIRAKGGEGVAESPFRDPAVVK